MVEVLLIIWRPALETWLPQELLARFEDFHFPKAPLECTQREATLTGAKTGRGCRKTVGNIGNWGFELASWNAETVLLVLVCFTSYRAASNGDVDGIRCWSCCKSLWGNVRLILSHYNQPHPWRVDATHTFSTRCSAAVHTAFAEHAAAQKPHERWGGWPGDRWAVEIWVIQC